LPFDDHLPKKEDLTSDSKYYDLFGKCFNNNARFSIIKPVPNIGDDTTDI